MYGKRQLHHSKEGIKPGFTNHLIADVIDSLDLIGIISLLVMKDVLSEKYKNHINSSWNSNS